MRTTVLRDVGHETRFLSAFRLMLLMMRRADPRRSETHVLVEPQAEELQADRLLQCLQKAERRNFRGDVLVKSVGDEITDACHTIAQENMTQCFPGEYFSVTVTVEAFDITLPEKDL